MNAFPLCQLPLTLLSTHYVCVGPTFSVFQKSNNYNLCMYNYYLLLHRILNVKKITQKKVSLLPSFTYLCSLIFLFMLQRDSSLILCLCLFITFSPSSLVFFFFTKMYFRFLKFQRV